MTAPFVYNFMYLERQRYRDGKGTEKHGKAPQKQRNCYRERKHRNRDYSEKRVTIKREKEIHV